MLTSSPTLLRLGWPFKWIECQKTKTRSTSVLMVSRFHPIRPPRTKLLIWSHAKLLYQRRWRFYLQSSSEWLRLLWLQCQQWPRISLLDQMPGPVLHFSLLCQFLHQCLLRPLLANPDSCPLNPGHHLPNPGQLVLFLLMYFLLINRLFLLHSIGIHFPWRTILHLDEFWIGFWVLMFPYL